MCGNEAQKASRARERLSPRRASYIATNGGVVAEWLRSGLQIRVRRFDSGRRLQPALRPLRYALLKLARFTQVHRLVPAFLFRRPNVFAYFLFGARSRSEKRIMNHIILNADPHFVKWSIGAILRWSNHMRPQNIFHIHGDKDKILPIHYTHPDAVVKNGSHFMVWTKAGEVSKLLAKALR